METIASVTHPPLIALSWNVAAFNVGQPLYSRVYRSTETAALRTSFESLLLRSEQCGTVQCERRSRWSGTKCKLMSQEAGEDGGGSSSRGGRIPKGRRMLAAASQKMRQSSRTTQATNQHFGSKTPLQPFWSKQEFVWLCCVKSQESRVKQA